jgi:hypothetical protein
MLSGPLSFLTSLKDNIVAMFRQETSSETLKSVTCAACAESCLSESSQVNIHDIDLNVLTRPDRRPHENSKDDMVDSDWLDSEVTGPHLPSPIPSMKDVLLDPGGVHVFHENDNIFLTLCKTCKSSIMSGKVPPLSLANHMILGAIPAELKDLTIVEEAMIARCRAKCWIMKKTQKVRHLQALNTL